VVYAGFFCGPLPVLSRPSRDGAGPLEPGTEWLGFITSYDHVNAILRTHDVFSSAGRMAALLDTLPETDRARFLPIYDHFAVGLIRSDPPDHMRLRRLISAVFTPRII